MKINWVPNKNVNERKVSQLMKIPIETGQFTNYSHNVKELEKVIREKLQINNNKSVIVVSNGSVALHCLASGINHINKKEIQWATQSFTFPPSAQGTLSNAKIVDIDQEGGLDLSQIDNEIDGIIVTNIFGNLVNINKYEDWAKKNNKFLIFDNAATPFSFYNGKSCCNYGHGCTISFHHTKPLGFGEGGAIIVNKEYEDVIRKLCNFGIFINDDGWTRDGNNYKMSEISAIYILQYLDNFDFIVSKHQKLYEYFKKKIDKIPNVKLFPSYHDDNKIVPSCLCILFDKYDDNVRKKLLENDVFCRKYYNPLKETKNTMDIFNRILCLPCTVDMNEKEIDFIVNILKN